jgi:hypothetical protein
VKQPTAVALILGSAAVIIMVVLSLVLIHITDPMRQYDLDTEQPVAPTVTYEDNSLLPYNGEEVYRHPITGRIMSEEEIAREEATLKAILCSMGEEEHCEKS